MKNTISITLIGGLILCTSCMASPQNKTDVSNEISGPYTANWESLRKYDEEKEWLKDAKFGIYTHWGVSSLPISKCPVTAGWYPRRMYQKKFSKGRVFDFHKETYGDQHQFGYKDFVPLFTAENFNAKEWMTIFKNAGAKFAGPVAIHHDNFAMWDSAFTEWNAAQKGPRRDICRELSSEARKQGMKVVMSMHHAGSWVYYIEAYEYDADDKKYAGLYLDKHKLTDPTTDKFNDYWLNMVKDLVDNYAPDILYFDHCMGRIRPEKRREMVAHCYNRAAERDQEFVLLYKGTDLDKDAALRDYEVHYPNKKLDKVWMTDWSLTHWFPNQKSTYESGETIIHRLADIVSKNGVLLLNVPPTPDGRINKESKQTLKEIGDWLAVNGVAIYSTRPWSTYGVGPNLLAKTKPIWMGGAKKSIFTSEDIRFTQSKDGKTIYAIVLGWPESGYVKLEPLLKESGNIKDVSLVGHTGKLKWTCTEKAIKIMFPESKPCESAFVLKIKLK